MSDRSKDLLEAVDELQPAMIDFTGELVSIPTENPPGNEYARCVEVIERKLKEIGLNPRVVETPTQKRGSGPGYCVTAGHGEGEPTLHFHGHYDVVPRSVEGQFDPVIQGGNLFGRGSSDMKSGLASMVYAVHALRRARVRLNGRVELIIADFAKGSVGMLTAEPTSGVVWRCCL